MPSPLSYALVEGEYKNFVFRRIVVADYPRVLEHFDKYFLRDEPTCKLLGYTKQFSRELSLIVVKALKDNMSFVAEEKSTGEIATIRIIFREGKDSSFNDVEMKDHRTIAFYDGIDLTKEQKEDIFRTWNTDEYAELFIVSTAPQFQRQGISMELYQRSLEFLKAEGFKIVKCVFTSPTTRRAAEKLNFKEYSRIQYDSMKDSNGKLLFDKDKLSEEHYASIQIKGLE